MATLLADCPDFAGEKSILEHRVLQERNIFVRFLPRFHPELSPVELMWAHMKQTARRECGYNMPWLKRFIAAYLSADHSAEIDSYYRHTMKYVEAYREGLDSVQVFKKVYKSHRKVRAVSMTD